MKYKVQLLDFPNSIFTIVKSMWTGKSKLFRDTIEVKQATDKGKPFLIQGENGQIVFVFIKHTYPELFPVLEIEGKLYHVVEKLKWYEYVIGGLPFVLLSLGGLVGGGIGAVASLTNFNVLRQEGKYISKIVQVIGITGVSFLAYFCFIWCVQYFSS